MTYDIFFHHLQCTATRKGVVRVGDTRFSFFLWTLS